MILKKELKTPAGQIFPVGVSFDVGLDPYDNKFSYIRKDNFILIILTRKIPEYFKENSNDTREN